MKLSSPQPARETTLTCYHCGDPCRETTVFQHDHTFCCDGCRLVYGILSENDLCTYYTLEGATGNAPDKSIYKERFDYLDNPSVNEKLLQFSDGRHARITFFIPRMHCSSCIWLLEHLQRLDKGITASSVHFPRKEVTIDFRQDGTRLSSIAELLARIGYEPHISLEEAGDREKRSSNRSYWYKIGVAGFCFGNIMLLSFPEYFSIGEVAENATLRTLFGWLNLLLALPVLLYSSRDFFVSALGAIRSRHLNIDLPIAAAILMTFLRSLYELGSGTGPGYFDSMTGIVFFMLIGRAFQHHTFTTLSFDRDYKSYFPIAVTVLGQEGGVGQLPVTELRKGMRMLIRNQEIVPADAFLLSGNALIDYSFVTGESDPVPRQKGEIIYAGGRQTGTAIELEIVKPVKQSYLTQLWNSAAFRKDDAEAERASQVNKINQYFTAGVFILAVLSAGWWLWQGDVQRMANAATTILIVACPCILLLAATFTHGNVLRILGRNKLYLKNAFVIEQLAAADTIVFDKTGTITSGTETRLRFEGLPLNEEEEDAVYALAAQSSHPLSRKIAAGIRSDGKVPLLNFREFPGKGIEAEINCSLFRLGSAAFTGQEKAGQEKNISRVYLSIDGLVRGAFSLRHTLRNDFPELIHALRGTHELYLLSGDTEADRPQLAPFFKPQNMIFQCSPGEKMAFISLLQRQGKKVIMLGDGLNDAGALRQSNAGIAVSGDINNFSPACDAILQGESIGKLDRLIRYCRSAKRVVAGSFALSLLYNVIGLYFALRGELQPVIAAILMPAASVSIVSTAILASSLIARHRKL